MLPFPVIPPLSGTHVFRSQDTYMDLKMVRINTFYRDPNTMGLVPGQKSSQKNLKTVKKNLWRRQLKK